MDTHAKIKVLEPAGLLNRFGFLHKESGGQVYPPFIDPAAVKYLQKNWDTEENDIFVCSHQKVGTHLLEKFIVEVLLSALDFPASHPMANGDIGHAAVPWPEVMVSQWGAESFESFRNATKGMPRVWYIHCPPEDLPFRSIHPKSKFAFVFRDPRGVAVSQYFFYKKHPLLQVDPLMTADQFVEFFVKGNLYFGDYHRHTSNWLNQCNGRLAKEQLIVFRFEELVNRKVDCVKAMARFFVPDAEMPSGEMLRIAESTEFVTMKKEITDNPRSFHFNPNTFFRSGRTDDWQEILSPESIAQIEAKTIAFWPGGDMEKPVISKNFTIDNFI
jgi:hypothetical protein